MSTPWRIEPVAKARSHGPGAALFLILLAMALRPALALAEKLSELSAKPVMSAAVVSSESEVKAAFLYNFMKFIEWPERCFADAQSPYVIGVLSHDALAADLERLVQNRKINGRAIVVKTVHGAAEAASVHILFVSSAEQAQFESLKGLERVPVVTVGEATEFTRSGGMIGFVLQDSNVRFEINADVAEKAGVRISAQLQKLATNVRRML